MKVVHVTNAYVNNGTGITNLLRTLALEQRAAGLEVMVAAEEGGPDYLRELAEHGIEYVEIGSLRDPASVRRVSAKLRSWTDVDVFHVHTMRAAIAVLGAGRRVRERSVATVHNVYQPSSALMTACAATVCISASARDRIRRRVPWSAGRLHVVFNAVDAKRLAASMDLPPCAVVYVGGLHRRKGVDLLLGYFAEVLLRVPEAQLFVVGNRDQPDVERLAQVRGIADSVTFLGFMPEPSRAMRAATVMVIPSRDEPFGLVAAEARVCGAPIVASDIDGLREALDGGRAGELVPVGATERWAEAVARVLTDADHRSALRARALAGVEAFDPGVMERAYRRIYESLQCL